MTLLLLLGGDFRSTYDYEAPNGREVLYRARALHNYGGAYAASDWAVAASTWASSTWWLKDPLNPAQNTPIVVHSQPGIDRPARQGVFQPLGARFPIVVSDTRLSERGALVLRVDTQEVQAAINTLLNTGGTLLVQGRPADHWSDRYVVIGDHGRSRIADKGFIESVFDTLPWVEVRKPAGQLTAA